MRWNETYKNMSVQTNNFNNMKAYVYSGEISTPDFKYKEENIYTLIELIKFLPDSDVIAFSVQDLKNLIGIKPESSRDFSLK